MGVEHIYDGGLLGAQYPGGLAGEQARFRHGLAGDPERSRATVDGSAPSLDVGSPGEGKAIAQVALVKHASMGVLHFGAMHWAMPHLSTAWPLVGVSAISALAWIMDIAVYCCGLSHCTDLLQRMSAWTWYGVVNDWHSNALRYFGILGKEFMWMNEIIVIHRMV